MSTYYKDGTPYTRLDLRQFDLLDYYFHLPERDKYGRNMIMLSCVKKNENDITKIIVKSLPNISLDSQDFKGRTALMEAVKNNNFEIVKFFLKEGKANPNLQDNQGNNAFLEAVKSGNLTITKFFVEKKIGDFNVRDKKGRTALMESVKSGRFDFVKLIVSKTNADVNVQDAKGITALMEAVRYGRLEICKFLINKGRCDLSRKDEKNRTAQDFLDEIQPGLTL
jgi:ankyrin repeat protein